MAKVTVTETYLENIADAIREKNGLATTYKPSQMAGAIEDLSVYPEPTGTKSITENGSGIDVKDYASANVNVPNSYGAGDEGKVVSNGALKAQTSKNIGANGTVDTTENNEVVVAVPNSYSQSDEGKVVDNGALVAQTSATKNANGTYDTTKNNEIVIAVPNTYAAGDEGKVVSNGALVAQGSDTVTQNDTYDTTLINSLTVQVAGGGSTLVTKNITQNGTYNPADDNADGYSEVTVSVSGGESLPSAYQEVEYLTTASNTATYVEVPFKFQKAGDVFTFKVQAQVWGTKYPFGIKTSIGQGTGTGRVAHGVANNQKRIYCVTGTMYDTQDPTKSSSGTEVIYGSVSDGEKVTFSITAEDDYSTSMRYIYYGAYGTGSNSYCPSADLYGLTVVHSDGTKCMDLIPCYRKADSVCGFYDMRTNMFFTAAAGSFTAGADVN